MFAAVLQKEILCSFFCCFFLTFASRKSLTLVCVQNHNSSARNCECMRYCACAYRYYFHDHKLTNKKWRKNSNIRNKSKLKWNNHQSKKLICTVLVESHGKKKERKIHRKSLQLGFVNWNHSEAQTQSVNKCECSQTYGMAMAIESRTSHIFKSIRIRIESGGVH